jgi:segregation and condensation protein B
LSGPAERNRVFQKQASVPLFVAGSRTHKTLFIRYHTLGTYSRMSLKAKLEAVIYAAEEPVTLAQLALLFTADALEYKAEQAAAMNAAQAADGSHETSADDEIDYSALVEDTSETDPVETSALAPESAVDAEGVSADEIIEESAATPTEGDSKAAEAVLVATEVSEEANEANLKREARQRDREVRAILRQILDELIAEYATDDRGVEIREIAGGFRMATKPECHDVVRAFVKSLKPAMKLSLPALETLAVIAYKQPVTAPEVNEIRGVDSSGVFGSLLARKLISTAGRKPVIGRPILYKTTKEFLMRFGLKDVSELPSMEEFEKMAAIELEEAEADGQAEAEPELQEDMSVEEDAKTEQASNESQSIEEGENTEAAPAEPPPTQ